MSCSNMGALDYMKRNDKLDMTRGLAILLIIYGHFMFGINRGGEYIYIFHVPIFFVISGILFNDNYDFRTFLTKKD